MMTEVKTRPSLIKAWLQISKRQATRCSFSIFARSAAEVNRRVYVRKRRSVINAMVDQ